jgi:hypothetical protein
MSARPEVVWSWLILAVRWPSWYPNSRNVEIEKGSRPDLAAKARFTWKTNGVSLRSKVEEFVPFERLAWDARAMGVEAYHAWLIEPRADGCWVLTEETQKGWLARLGATLMPKKMFRVHQTWLERLRSMAAEGPP